MEEFNFDIEFDESAVVRMNHADFLNQVKEWSLTLSKDLFPFFKLFEALQELDSLESVNSERLAISVMVGIKIIADNLNEMYNIIQTEAVKVLGSPFALHDEHYPDCDGTKEKCGHQDHWAQEEK
jgi:hypothetical protein